jgi:hypothetical protein
VSKLELNLTEFIKTGCFGFIELGMSKTEIETQFFPPENWLNKKSKESSEIWRYGNFELHFNNTLNLSGIFNDYLPELNGGENINIKDYWLLQKGTYNPTLGEAIQSLNKIGVDYCKTTPSLELVTLTLANSVYLMFENANNESDVNNFNLTALGKK